MPDWNKGIIEEFRANEGRVGGVFANMPLLLLHHTGAKSGVDRVSPLAYQKIDDGYAIFASKGGSNSNPAWYHNIKANPEVTIEVGTNTLDMKARVVNGEEYELIWTRQKRDFPQFARYEEKTTRDRIPVVVLEDA